MDVLESPKTRSSPEEMSLRYRLFRTVMLFLGRVLLGFTVYGEEKMPRKGAMVVAANHTQYLDPVYVCMAIPRRVQWMGKKELFVFPFRPLFYFIGTFPVDREGGGRAGLRTALNFLARGWALGIFPEGTHRTGEGSREAKSGTVLLAARGGAPVLPIFVGESPGLSGRLRGERLRVYVGDPISVDARLRGRDAYRSAADEILRVIYALPEQGSRESR
ncbi:MAG TPA: lysophospholipid acyltransferase family protein [Rubrobacteraceae bacterium]|nr:lysophospholipid acyltransferase family protein [Rubrobacteraceae bacterium]